MNLHDTLTTITVVGLVTSFVAGVTSQIWKSSIEVEGQLTKRLTPAGWLSLGIALVGLLRVPEILTGPFPEILAGHPGL